MKLTYKYLIPTIMPDWRYYLRIYYGYDSNLYHDIDISC